MWSMTNMLVGFDGFVREIFDSNFFQFFEAFIYNVEGTVGFQAFCYAYRRF